MSGVPGKRVVTLKMDSVGTFHVDYALVRPWNSDEIDNTIEGAKTITITVSDHESAQ